MSETQWHSKQAETGFYRDNHQDKYVKSDAVKSIDTQRLKNTGLLSDEKWFKYTCLENDISINLK